MELNQVLEKDAASIAEVLTALDAIATQLQDFKTRYPLTFAYLCNEGRMGADFTLPDAAMAVAEACDHLAEYGES